MQKTENKISSALILAGFLTFLMIISCDTVKKREKVVHEIENEFHSDRDIYSLLEDYFSNPNSYLGFTFNYSNSKIVLKQEDGPTDIDSISQVKDDLEVFKILQFMRENKIRDISGNAEWIKVTLEESRIPCFSIWYRYDFDLSKAKTKEQLTNFTNSKTKNWIYSLEERWFIKGEACF